MEQFTQFYKLVICKKRFYLPIIFFALVAYSFSIYNRTVSIDSLMGDYTVGNKGMSMLAGRWGMVVWCRLLGIMGNDPFIDRFLALWFLCMAGVLLCYILYSVRGINSVIPYTLVVSVFITYPLINEIWEYVGADYMVGGNLCLVTIAAIIISSSPHPSLYKILCATAFLILPMSSYETGIFYYISLVEIYIFLKVVEDIEPSLNFLGWIKKNFYYCLPLAIAFLARFSVSFIINSIYGLEYSGGGATDIIWLEYDFFPTLKGLIVSNFLHYFVYGLVYFPITVFAFSILFFICFLFSKKTNRLEVLLLGMTIFISLFILALIQGDLLMYRHAQTITLFVAFAIYLACISTPNKWNRYLYVLLFSLCWYQAVYINKLLGLNNLRSDNELAIVRQLGSRIVSGYDKKPVVFVGVRPSLGSWISNQVAVDESSWNGAFFSYIMSMFDKGYNKPVKYVGTNVNSVMEEYMQLQNLFSYCGYDFEILPNYFSGENSLQNEEVRKNADNIAAEKNLVPYQIYDNGNFLIVHLGGDL